MHEPNSHYDDETTPHNTPKHPTPADDLKADNPKSEDPCDLGERQWVAIEMLAAGKNNSQVARSLEVDRKTLYVWRQKELFRRVLAERRRQLWGEVSARLRGMVHPSLDELDAQLHDRYDRARFRAATAILRLVDVKKCPEPQEDE